jgi:hypothetical protein
MAYAATNFTSQRFSSPRWLLGSSQVGISPSYAVLVSPPDFPFVVFPTAMNLCKHGIAASPHEPQGGTCRGSAFVAG